MEYLQAELWYPCLSHSLLKRAVGRKKKIHWGEGLPATGHEVSGCSGWFSLDGPNGRSERLKWDFVSTLWRTASQKKPICFN